MQVKILGCSGGIGGDELQTTSILINENTIIDAGTGLVSLTLEQLTRINSIFITHAHMDHIASCPMLIDSTAELRTEPLVLYALSDTIDSIRKHIFNWEIWPDFSEINVKEFKSLKFCKVEVGDEFEIPGAGKIIVGPAKHQIQGCSYLLIGKHDKLFFSGDTSYDKSIIEFINHHKTINHIIIECAFSKKDQELAKLSNHLDAQSVTQMIKEFDCKSKIYITHLKPSQRDLIMDEILEDEELMKNYHVSRLFAYQVFTL